MSTRISGPPTNARFQRGIREGPTTTSSGGGDKGYETGARVRVPAEPVVIMRSDDGGIEILAEDRTYTLTKRELRALLFLRHRVVLEEDEDGTERATAAAGPFNRRWIGFSLAGTRYYTSREKIVAVLLGRAPAEELFRAGVP